MANIIRPVKGTRDFYPEEMARRNWLYNNIRAVSERFGYQEFEAPILETLELYASKSGEELVREQAFVFNDRSGDTIALRPELTPSLARMIAQREQQLPRPVRWWSFGPFWRYERPQKGRSREFFQWNIDIIGVDAVIADAEIATIGAEFLRQLNLTPDQVVIQINNRKLMETKIAALGIAAEARPGVLRLIDRVDKLKPEAWENYGRDVGLDDAQLAALRALLENRELWRESDELQEFFETVNALGSGDWVEFEPSIVRGLDYYTGTVMEARDRDGEFRAVFGGGRYDNLVSDVGGAGIAATGFAMGDVVMGLVAEKYGVVPQMGGSPATVLVTIFDSERTPAALQVAQELRTGDIRAELYPLPDRLGKQFKYADRQGIPLAVVAGPDELANDQVAIKDLASGEQTTVARAELVAKIKSWREKASD